MTDRALAFAIMVGGLALTVLLVVVLNPRMLPAALVAYFAAYAAGRRQ